METTSLCYSPLLPPRPFSGKSLHRKTAMQRQHRRGMSSRVFVARKDSHDQNYGGKLVDENMIVLRKRIHEMKMIERNDEAPLDWMEWEKQYYTNYDSDICEAMGLLQSLLMNTRPSLALGMVALITLSVPASMVMVLFNLMEIGKWILSGIHLC
ncbi:hypothetical protein HHK36_024553 [Tetracentron sinense]|uniref:Mediator of RNA polymerase II transcription subunit n=1 Tax=Tetracentron sinense TaxID=13715 RepID=A0A835D6T6_TETSI|nr:hypothetical protein HHK36_024553 [Tetracentron sinense]